jgi:hypothetical protein
MKLIDQSLTELGWFLQDDIQQAELIYSADQELGRTIDTAFNHLTLILEEHALNHTHNVILRRAASQSRSLILRK